MVGSKLGVLALATSLGFSMPALADTTDGLGNATLFLKGGIARYTGSVGDYLNAGPNWGLIVGVQPFSALGFEVGYEGSRNTLDDARLLGDTAVMRHGGTALVKISPPFLNAVRPFLGAGLGFSYASLQGDAGGLYESDLMEEVPLAAGLEFNSGRITAGLRFTYRFLLDEGFAEPAYPGASDGNLFDASATLGARF